MKNKLTLLVLLSIVTLSACRKNTEFGSIDDESGWGIKRRWLTLDSLKTITSNIPKAYYADLAFTDSTTGYAVTTGTIVKTTDGGHTWASTPSPSDLPLTRIQFTDSQTGYIAGGAGNAGVLLKTTNAGQTWAALNFGATQSLTGMYFVSNTTGFIIGTNLFSKTTDGGLTWTSIKDAGVTGFYDIRFRDDKTGVATAAKGVYFKTINGGFTWQKAQATTLNDLGNVYFSPTKTLIDISGGNLMDVDGNMAVTKVDPYISKLLFMDERNAIGISTPIDAQGVRYSGGVFSTNFAWQGGIQIAGSGGVNEKFAYTTIAPMTADRIMLIGTGTAGTKVTVINAPLK